MPRSTNVFVLNCERAPGDEEADDAMRITWALQGLVNQSSAEVYVVRSSDHLQQLKESGRSFEVSEMLPDANAGLRTLFKRYQGNVKKMFLYDPQKDWTWCLALMAGAQQHGIPVTEQISRDLAQEFGWKGEVQDFRNRWPTRIAAYDWAVTNLMPNCNKQVVFTPRPNHSVIDYAVASKGFTFWLNFKTERAEVEKIFGTPGYGVGTSLMGYANTGDGANTVANPFGIGYVVSGHFANGSFWSSFPNQTYSRPPRQSPGRARKPEPGRIYVSLKWSEGDNLAFAQNQAYHLWSDPMRGQVPMATALNPVLQEIDPPLLEWYYSNLTTNDELVGGATGFQFISLSGYKADQFPAWCRLTRDWIADAGLHGSHVWFKDDSTDRVATYLSTCGFSGIFSKSEFVKPGYPPSIRWERAVNENNLFQQLSNGVTPDPKAPVFINFMLTTESFVKSGGYASVKRQIDRIEKAYPGRYIFLLPKDQFATMLAWYHREK